MEDIKFETAKLAQEVGFPQEEFYPCFADDGEIHTSVYFHTHPDKKRYYQSTQSLLQKWLREDHKILVTVDIDPDIYNCKVNYSADVKNCDPYSEALGLRMLDGFTVFQSYEDALEEGLQEALKLIKNI